MEKYAVIQKNIGQTPLEALTMFRKKNAIGEEVPLTYAGRLDPLAEGKLLVLIGDECKKKESYLSLDKEYEFDILLGVGSDSGDVLGLVSDPVRMEMPTEKGIKKVLRSLVGARDLPYPLFSSKTVSGKPLFEYGHEKVFPALSLPTKHVRVYRLTYVSMCVVSWQEIVKNVEERVRKITVPSERSGPVKDFRQTEVLERWGVPRADDLKCPVITVRAIVSSGTYIRSLAPLIAEKLGTVGLAFSIDRTRIGKYFPMTKKHGMWYRTVL